MVLKYWRVLPIRNSVRSVSTFSRSTATLIALSIVLILVVACADGGDTPTETIGGVTPTAEQIATSSPTPVTLATTTPTSIPDTPVSVAPTVAVIPTLTPTAIATPKLAVDSDPTATTAPSGAVVPTGTPTAIATVTPTLPTATIAPTRTPVPTNTAVPSTPSPTPTYEPELPIATAEPTATVDPNVTVEPTATTAPPTSQELASEGAGIYETNCTGCHSRDSDTVIGPGHRNVYSRAGTRVPGLSADEYIRQSLSDPGAFVVSGFPSIMPKFTFFTEQQILAVIEYLKSL